MRKILLVLAAIILLAIIFYLPKWGQKKENPIVDACKISSNLAYAEAHQEACEKKGFHTGICKLSKQEEMDVLIYRNKLVHDCTANASFDY